MLIFHIVDLESLEIVATKVGKFNSTSRLRGFLSKEDAINFINKKRREQSIYELISCST